MQRPGIPKIWIWWATLPLCLAASLAFWMRWGWQPDRWLANRLYLEMESAGEDEVEVPARQLGALGEAGWEALVRGLYSPRPAVRVASDRAIRESLDSWKQLPGKTVSSRAALLADLLTKNRPTAEPESLQLVGNLAEQLLARGEGGAGTKWVYDCEQVLRAAQQAGYFQAARGLRPPTPPDIGSR